MASVRRSKITTDSGLHIRLWVHKQLARAYFQQKGILVRRAFNKVNWEVFYTTLHKVPWVFQVWASKQICNNTATNQLWAKFM